VFAVVPERGKHVSDEGGRHLAAVATPSTAHAYFMLWEWDGTLERIHHALYVATREREGREASPTAAIIDSQSATPTLTRSAHCS
jgi:hypothetical protein